MGSHISQLLKTSAVFTILTVLPMYSKAESIKGTIKIPSDFKPHLAFKSSGFLDPIPSDAIRINPPSIDPRRSMVVVLEGASLPQKSPLEPTITMRDSLFDPPVMPVTPHTKVKFINKDRAVHILEPYSAKTDFVRSKHLGSNEEFTYTFNKLGIHQIKCSEIPHMIATIFVTKTNFMIVPNADGTFQFSDIPKGTFTIKVWYFGKWLYIAPIVVKGKTSVEIMIHKQTTASQD